MYRFQIRATTRPGETIALVGSIPAMGCWDIKRCVRLQTSGDRYPLWWVDLDVSAEQVEGDRSATTPSDLRAEYKYVRLPEQDTPEWEVWGTNRWVPIETEPLPSLVIVEDGEIGTIPACPYGYFPQAIPHPPVPDDLKGLKIAVIGSSVALGCNAWLLRGWAWHLGQALQQRYGHYLINVSEIGANVGTTIARFSQAVAPHNPDVVIISLSLGNEGLAFAPPHQQRAIQQRFESGLLQLIKMTRELGAQPILGSVYPNGNYSPEHYRLLQETHQRMKTWGVSVLDWLSPLDDGRGRWKPGIFADHAHPNTDGHHLMFEAIDLNQFNFTKADLTTEHPPHPPEEVSLFRDEWGFHIFARKTDHSLRIINTTPHSYTLSPNWKLLQNSLRAAPLPPGLHLAEDEATGALHSVFVQDDGTIRTNLTIPSGADLTFYPAIHFFAPKRSQVLFYNQHLAILRVGDRRLYLINESDHDYYVHPMWKEIRTLLKAMPSGVYEDPVNPDAPFRTMMIGLDGLESRVKVAAQLAIALEYQCSLSDINRVAILGLGDRCAVRMLLHKMEYDGPAFPFDLTRTTKVSDVADIIENGFDDMWNPAYLNYSPSDNRVYHSKWTGLSFGHEVEDSDDPLNDMSPIYKRMRTRYSARSRRFWYTLQHADKFLFVRTGGCDRASVVNLLEKLKVKCQGKSFRLLIISPQPSEEFADLPNVQHYNLEFNPDRMYADIDHWLYCTDLMRKILSSLSISSKNLFWCPP